MKVIIIGAGEVGFHIARRLSSEAKDVVVIDRDPKALRRIIEYVDVQTIEGSGSAPAVLESAGIRNADVLLAVTDSDEINIIACTFASALAPDLVKLARIRNDDYVNVGEHSVKDLLKIDKTINPDVEVVKAIEQVVAVPQASEIIDFAGGRVKLVGYKVGESPVVGRKLIHLPELMQGVSVIIAAIVRDEKLIIPSGEDVIERGDLVYFVCMEDRVLEIMTRLGSKAEPVKSVLIIGGGYIGFRLAQRLEGRYHVRLVESDADRCQYLAQHLSGTIVLNGEGRDQDLLREENVQEMDLVISLTGDEETNILTSLLAKSLGAKRAVTRINKFAYFPLVRAIGIENIVSPRQSAVNSILQYMRKGMVISAASIRGDEAEALEAIVPERSDLVDKAIKDLKLPKGALILTIQRGGEIVFPSGDAVIKPGDRIVILSTRKTISRIEKRLEVKLESV
ncbi:MAG: Trk system potassium transporter TrkA [Proteobacteria bacterium]|nr:Trk system potassium transporter TrkA [Pseudomonadota bacterium]